jgi:hypothetical protein
VVLLQAEDYLHAIEEFPTARPAISLKVLLSSFTPQMGDSYYNLKRYTPAVQTYSRKDKEFPKSKEAEADFGMILSPARKEI